MATVLKFWVKKLETGEETVTLDTHNLKEITHDEKAKVMPKDAFLHPTYKVRGVYITKSNMIMKLATDADSSINALYCRHKGSHIVILPEKAQVYLDGFSVDPKVFNVMSVLSGMKKA